MAETAIVLMVFEPALEGEIIEKLDVLPFVVEAHFLYGPYDGYVKIVAESSQALTNLVSEIRTIEGIRSTVTCIVADYR